MTCFATTKGTTIIPGYCGSCYASELSSFTEDVIASASYLPSIDVKIRNCVACPIQFGRRRYELFANGSGNRAAHRWHPHRCARDCEPRRSSVVVVRAICSDRRGAQVCPSLRALHDEQAAAVLRPLVQPLPSARVVRPTAPVHLDTHVGGGRVVGQCDRWIRSVCVGL